MNFIYCRSELFGFWRFKCKIAGSLKKTIFKDNEPMKGFSRGQMGMGVEEVFQQETWKKGFVDPYLLPECSSLHSWPTYLFFLRAVSKNSQSEIWKTRDFIQVNSLQTREMQPLVEN